MATSGPNNAGSATNLSDGGATTWANPANATGANNDVYAVWTKAGGVASGTLSQALELSAFGTFAGVNSGDTINSVQVQVNVFVNITARIDQIRVQLYDGTTPLGTEQQVASTNVTTTVISFTVTGVTFAQLATLRVRVKFRAGATTTTATGSVDYAALTVDYTVAPVAYTRTPTDALGLSDTPVRDDVAATRNDRLTLGDTVAPLHSVAYTRSQDDHLGLADEVLTAAAQAALRGVDDVLGLADSPTSRTVTATGVDALDLTDAASTLLFGQVDLTVDDTVALSDTGFLVAKAAVGVDDLLLADAVSAQTAAPPTLTRAVTDTLGLSDTGFLVAKAVVGVDDLSIADAVSAVRAEAADLTRQVDDTLSLLDTDQPLRVHLTQTVSSTLGLSDTGNLVSKAAIGVDPILLTDHVAAQLGPNLPTLARQVDDTLTLVDVDEPLRLDVAETLTSSLGLRDSAAVTGDMAVGVVAAPAWVRDTTRLTTSRVASTGWVRVTAPV